MLSTHGDCVTLGGMQKETRAHPPTVGAVVGQSLKRLRKERRWTQDAAASQVSSRGLTWKRAHIADLENGRREALDIGALVVLADVLDARLPDLFEGEGDVLLTPRADWPEHAVSASRAQLRGWLAGERSEVRIDGHVAIRAALHPASSKLEAAIAEREGFSLQQVLAAAHGLWGRSLTEERDKRVADLGDLPIGERQAKQGHITRDLAAELIEWVANAEGSEDG